MQPAAQQDWQHWQRVDEIFAAVIETPPRERAARLDGLCGSDAVLRADVSRLLASDGRVEAGFLEPPAAMPPPSGPAAAGATADRFLIQECSGTIIGPYTLHEQIGEGGFGVVYLAEQHRPVRRRVALKIIKPGMDTRQVIARFQAERQALALMDHPHIARVLDGGETAAGLPYFVMELVKGIPITEYCDQCSLTARQRLELFIPVCQAVQHAHQKGIIHRDLKPSNVMIAMQDGQPAPKVIDFGVAKAINQRLTEHTVYTQFAQLVGTPLYMSPEQAEMSPLEVDTRSDIYSLGAMLYELLTGTTPFERERLRQVSLDDLRRIIRQEEPPTPSNRLSMLGDRAAAVAQHRRTDPRRLRQLVRGDLDWIVMKALEKDRTRRYETASAFGADLQRCLDDEPVQARPPSAMYRLRKLARRNKAAFVAASAIALGVLLAVAGLAVSNVKIRKEKAWKELALTDARESAQQAREAVDDFFTIVSENELFDEVGLQPLRKQLLEAALDYYQKFVDEHPDDPKIHAAQAAAHFRMWQIYQDVDQYDDAIAELARGLDIVEQLQRAYPHDAEVLKILTTVRYGGEAFHNDWTVRRRSEARQTLERGIQIWATLAADNPGIPEFQRSLAETYGELANQHRLDGYKATSPPESQAHFAEALVAAQKGFETLEWLGRHHPALLEPDGELEMRRAGLSVYLRYVGDLQQAETVLRQGLDYFEPRAVQFPAELRYQDRLARLYRRLAEVLSMDADRAEEAEQAWRRAIDLFENLVAEKPGLPSYLWLLGFSHFQFGMLLKATGQIPDAEQAYNGGLLLFEKLVSDFPNSHIYWIQLSEILRQLADLYVATGRREEAEEIVRNMIEMLDKRSAEHPDEVHYQHYLGEAQTNLAEILRRGGQLAEARLLVYQAVAIGQRHPHRVDPWQQDRAYYALRDTLTGLGEATAVRALDTQHLQELRTTLRADSPELAHTLAGFTHALLTRGQFTEAEPTARECLTTCRQAYPDDHPDVWVRYSAVSMLGGALAGQAAALVEVDPQEAADLLAEAEPLLIAGYGGMRDSPRIAQSSLNFGFDNIGEALERTVQLYEAWDAAEPELGYDTEAAKWRAELQQWQAGTRLTESSAPPP